MFSADDTVVAIATPPGRGGIGVVRVSGPQASSVAGVVLALGAPLRPRHATLTRVRHGGVDDARLSLGDQVVCTFFPGPHSFTGEDVVEMSAHGSPVVLQRLVAAAMNAGARLAQRGEFTLRAFVHGKVDLVQAEAIGDLVSAVTPEQARVAYEQLDGNLTRRLAVLHESLFDLITRLEASLDFPEEGFHFFESGEVADRLERLRLELEALLSDSRRGRTIREGATVVLAGRPNVGKSSLFNALVGHDRAIVTPVPGTTRDLVTEAVDIGGVAVTLVDTAGFRDIHDLVEGEGVRRGRESADAADLVLVVIDPTAPVTDDDRRVVEAAGAGHRVVVSSKADMPSLGEQGVAIDIATSAHTGEGLGALRSLIAATLTGQAPGLVTEPPALSNLRHIALLEGARTHVEAALTAVQRDAVPEEFLLTHLQAARSQFDDVVGRRTSDDVLTRIFSTFCIGK